MPSTQSQVRLTISSLLEVCSYPLVSGKQQQLPPVATPSEEEGRPGEGAAVLSSQTLWQSGEQSHSKHVPNAAHASSAYAIYAGLCMDGIYWSLEACISPSVFVSN